MNFEGLRRAIVGAVSEPEIVSDFLDERIDGPWRETYRYEEEHTGYHESLRYCIATGLGAVVWQELNFSLSKRYRDASSLLQKSKT